MPVPSARTTPTIQESPVLQAPECYESDIQLTVLFLPLWDLRELSGSADQLAWIREWWQRHDPTPDTPENETLSVLRQRVKYIDARFPGLEIGDLPELLSVVLIGSRRSARARRP